MQDTETTYGEVSNTGDWGARHGGHWRFAGMKVVEFADRGRLRRPNEVRPADQSAARPHGVLGLTDAV